MSKNLGLLCYRRLASRALTEGANDQIDQNAAEFAHGLPAYASVAGESLLQIFTSAICRA